MSIHLYYDESDAGNPGWAYRDESEGSPLGSGPIDDPDQVAALDAIDAGHEWDADDLRMLADEIGCSPADLTYADRSGVSIGQVFPD